MKLQLLSKKGRGRTFSDTYLNSTCNKVIKIISSCNSIYQWMGAKRVAHRFIKDHIFSSYGNRVRQALDKKLEDLNKGNKQIKPA